MVVLFSFVFFQILIKKLFGCPGNGNKLMTGNEKVLVARSSEFSPNAGSINLPSECSQLTAQPVIRI